MAKTKSPSDTALLDFIQASSHQTKGAGARGGHVLGYTRSGKPIYEGHRASHAEYASFQPSDHTDASRLHEYLSGAHYKILNLLRHESDLPQVARQAQMSLIDHHENLFQDHKEAEKSHDEASFLPPAR